MSTGDWIEYSKLKQIRALSWGPQLSLEEQVATIAQALRVLKDERGVVFDPVAAKYFALGLPGIYPDRKTGYDITNELFNKQRLERQEIAVDVVHTLLAEKALEHGYSPLVHTSIAVPKEKGAPKIVRTSTVYLLGPSARAAFLEGLTLRAKKEDGGLKFDYNPKV